MKCDDDLQEREQPTLGDGGGLETTDPDEAVLVTSPSAEWPMILHAEYGVHTAVVRGLASYIAGLQSAIYGRYVSLTRVTFDWADYNDGAAASPSAAVYSLEEGKYEVDTGMAPIDPEIVDRSDPGRVSTLLNTSMYKLEKLTIDVRCGDKIERAGVRHMLETGCSPVEWMSGFRLLLPRYHNAIAEYLLVSAQQPDGQDSAITGVRPLSLTLQVRCPTYTAKSFPLARAVATGNIKLGKSRI